MFHRLLAFTIFTILIVGIVSSVLHSYNYLIVSSGGSPSYYSAFALKAHKQNSDDTNSAVLSSTGSDTLKQQQKADDLIVKAKQARIEAKVAADAANNATANWQALAAAADEADKVAQKILGSTQDTSNGTGKKKGEGESDPIGLVLIDAKNKHQEAKLAAKNAKKLSDKAIAMEKVANKAKELARQAQKDLNEPVNKVINNNDKGQAGPAKQDNKSKADSSEKASKAIQSNPSISGRSQSNSVSETQDSKGLNKSNSDEPSRQSPVALDIANLPIGKEKTTELKKNLESFGQIIDNASIANDSSRGGNHDLKLQAGSYYGEILARAEKNIRNATEPLLSGEMKNATKSSIVSPVSHADSGGTDSTDASNFSLANATVQNDTLISNQIAPSIFTENTTDVRNNTSGSVMTSQVDSNKCDNNDGITNISDTRTLNTNTSLVTECAAKGPLNAQSNNDSAIVPKINNDSLQYDGSVNCNIVVSNDTGSAITNNGLNMSVNKQDDGGCYPQASTSGQFRYIVWSEGDEDGRYILFKRSTDGGKTFEHPIRLSAGIPSAVFNPKVSSAGNNVYVVWQGDSQSGNQDILMSKSTDNGKTFANVINVSNDPAGSGNPEVGVNGSSIFVVWDGTTPGSNEIFYRKSNNNGSNFDGVKNLSNDGGISYEPKVILNKKNFEIYWRDYKNGHEDILMKKSINAGRTFDILQKLNKDILGLWNEKGLDHLLRN